MVKSQYEALSKERIKEIVRGARNSPNRSHIPWFYRGEIISLLARALKSEADMVVLDGRAFKIIYKDDGTAIVKPDNGDFVPMARLTIERYLREHDAYEQATKVTRLSSEGSAS